MASATETEVLGISENVQGVLLKERDTMARAGINVDEVVAKLRSLHAEAFAANQQQEALKRHLKAQTAYASVLLRKLYITASGCLDMAMGAVGKTSLAAKSMQRIRSRVRLPGSSSEPNPAAPA